MMSERKPVVLFRRGLDHEEEFEIVKKYFDVVEYRSQVPSDSLVIARFSALPYYHELEVDLASKNSVLINSKREHDWISDFDWYYYLKEFTPRTWFEYEVHLADYDGPMVLKGRTNSRKHQWRTHMYAHDRASMYDVASRLANDPLIGPQGLIYREYVPLKEVERCPISEQPYVNEWRFFFYKTHLLSVDYYWTNCSEPEKFKLAPEAVELADEVAAIASEHTSFFVLDIAEKAEGGWLLIEVNDGQMSGLSNNDPDILWSNMRRTLDSPTDIGANPAG